jgi:hypothetical protein
MYQKGVTKNDLANLDITDFIGENEFANEIKLVVENIMKNIEEKENKKEPNSINTLNTGDNGEDEPPMAFASFND